MTNKEKVLACSIGIFGIATITIGTLTRIEQKNYENNKSDFQRIQTAQSVLATVDFSEIKDYTLSSGSINEMSFVSSDDNDYSYKRYLRCDPAPTNNSVNDNSVKPEDICRISVGESMPIPNGDCSSFMFMDYRTLTDTSSKQWELQQYAYDGDYGIRMVDGCYCVATSSMYGDVGDKIRVTTDRGNTYWCIIADIKGYDSVGGWYHVNSQGAINLIEFVVDSDYIPNECWQMGDMGVIDLIGGDVVSIERI